MRPATIIIAICLLSITGFTQNNKTIANCFINFKAASGLKMAAPERLPADAEKLRKLPTSNGDVDVSRLDGYRIIYNNKKKAPFIDVKVELSDAASYGKDTVNILNNLQYLNSAGTGMETSGIIKLTFNGYPIYGISRNTIDSGSILGTFVMFPGNNTTVYFYFHNLKPEFRTFTSVDDYKGQRNAFLGEYTSHLVNCK
jgi:hypothetical protein